MLKSWIFQTSVKFRWQCIASCCLTLKLTHGINRISKLILEVKEWRQNCFKLWPCLRLKKKKPKHCNLSASLSYPGILRQTIENYTCKVSSYTYHVWHSSPERYLGLDICSWMKLLVKTCCKITYHVWQKTPILAKFCRWELKRLTNHFSIVMCSHYSPAQATNYRNGSDLWLDDKNSKS